MDRTLLIPESFTETGLGLWQEDGWLYVITPCCGSVVVGLDHRVFSCKSCERPVATAKGSDMWMEKVEISDWNFNGDPKDWNQWLKFWFGFEEGGIEVDW